MTTPAVRALAQSFPQARIDFMTQVPAHCVYLDSPHIGKTHVVKWRLRELLPLLIEMRRQRYDLLIDFSGSSKTALFSWLTRVPVRIGCAGKKKSWCFTRSIDLAEFDGYTAFSKMALAQAAGANADDAKPEFPLPERLGSDISDRLARLLPQANNLIAVSPVSKRDYKVWPPDRFAAICDRLIENYGAQIVFLIGPGEAHFAQVVRDRMKHDSLPIDDSLSLYEAAGLLDLCACYIGNDNGLMHLSVARRRPSFGIFGRPWARHWTLPESWHQSIEYDPGCKQQCRYPECGKECLTGISVESVWQRLESFLRDETDLQVLSANSQR